MVAPWRPIGEWAGLVTQWEVACLGQYYGALLLDAAVHCKLQCKSLFKPGPLVGQGSACD